MPLALPRDGIVSGFRACYLKNRTYLFLGSLVGLLPGFVVFDAYFKYFILGLPRRLVLFLDSHAY